MVMEKGVPEMVGVIVAGIMIISFGVYNEQHRNLATSYSSIAVIFLMSEIPDIFWEIKGITGSINKHRMLLELRIANKV